MTAPDKITAADMRALLKATHPPQEYVVMFEVNEGTGTHLGRRADAIIASLWPSRGLELIGVEIKVSRSDWLAELKNPAKADHFAQHCDRWVVCAPSGVVKKPELPTGWGLWERRDNGTLRRSVQPGKNPQVQPMGRPFLMALLRARAKLDADEVSAIVREAKASAYKAGRDSVKHGDRPYASYDEDRLRAGLEKMAAIKEATGIDLTDYHPASHWIAKMKLADSKRLTFALNAVLKLLTNDDLKAMVQTALEVSSPNPDKKDADSW